MTRVQVDVCNVCVTSGKTEQALRRFAQEYEVVQGGRSGKVLLCAEHGEPFEAILPGKPGRKSTTDHGPTIAPITLGVGSALVTPAKKTAAPRKRTAKKATAKKTAAKRTATKRTATKKTAAKKATATRTRRPRTVTTPAEIAAQKAAAAEPALVAAG